MQNGTLINEKSPVNNTKVADQKTTEAQKPHVVPADTYTWDVSAKYAEEKYKELKDIPEKVKEIEAEFINAEKEHLEKSLQFLDRLSHTNIANLEQEKKEIAQLEEELKKLDQSRKTAEIEVNNAKDTHAATEFQAQKFRSEILELANKRNEHVGKIVGKELTGLKMKDKSDANHLFRFIFHAAYGRPGSEYDWKSFKKNSLEKNGLADLQGKMKSVNFQALNVDTSLLGNALNSNPAIQAEFEKKKPIPSLRALVEYAQVVREALDKNAHIATVDTQLIPLKEAWDQKNVALTQIATNYQNVENKLNVLRKYVEALQQVNTVVNTTKAATEEKIQEKEDALNEEMGKSKSPEKGKKGDKGKADSPVKGQNEEVNVGGDEALKKSSPKKEVQGANQTDFTDPTVGEQKQGGSCEGCNIF